MYSLNRKRRIQNKAKNSIAKKLETLTCNDKSFFVNVNGFLGYVKIDIPIPLKQFTAIKNRSKNVPIYIISAHGENIANLHFSRKSFQENIPIVEEKRDGNLFETSDDNQWVIHSAPVRSLVCPSKYDDPFLNYLTNDPNSVKNILFSKYPNRLFKNICFSPEKPTFKTPSFSLPGMPYPRKNYWFYDDPEKEKSYNWLMGVYPIFQSHKALSKLYCKEFVYRNTKQHDLENRLFNENVIEQLDWRGKSKLLKKYKTLTKIINDSLPKYDNKQKKWNDGKPISQKTIMDTLGPGIYISLSCSPFINQNECETPIDTDVINLTAEKLIEEVSKINLNVWGNYYLSRRLSRRINPKHKQEIYVDEKASKFGYNNTGIKISTNGRIICKPKLYEPDYISDENTSSSSSETQSDWSSSSEEEEN
tara:strand:+ start:2064 stop:3323 length:1260 start_codon:yes stop_codon:yes gene_type:complete